MRKTGFNMMFLFIAVGTMLLFVPPAMASRVVSIDVNPQTSSPGGKVPDITPVVNPNTAEYLYTVFAGQAVTDTIPVELCMTGSDASIPAWNNIDVSFGSAGGNLPGVTLPANQTFYKSASLPDCHTLNIGLATGPLNTVQNYVAIFNVSEDNPNPSGTSAKPNVVFADVKNFKITVVVLEPESSNVSCFLTDSSGMFLTDCASALVTESGSDDGRFAIVVNNKKNIQVATNPGQFYFNFVWYNSTGSAKTVDVNFNKYGVVPQGAQAIHSAVFSGDLSTVNPLVFDEVNSNGIPDGSDDKALGIAVPAESSLLVTYHLEWAGRGESAVGCITGCENANQPFGVTGTVSGSGITEESCTSTALGYKK